MKKSYLVLWTANSSTHGRLEGTNKKKLKTAAREIVAGNVFAGSIGSYAIYEIKNGLMNIRPIIERQIRKTKKGE